MISLTDAELLDFSQSFVELGQILTFRKEKNYSVQGRLKNYNNFSGVSGIQTLISDQKSDWVDYHEIFLNGQSFGSGIITNINYDANTEVRDKRFSISFVTSEEVDLYNAYGAYYTGVSGIQSEDVKFINSLSESYSFEKNNDETFSYSKDLSIQMESGIGTNPTQTAKNVAQILFNDPLNISGLSVFYPNYFESGNKIYRETYDIENLDYSFSESFNFQSGDPYIWQFSHSISREGNATVVTENGSIQSAAKPVSTAAQLGISDKLQATYARCSGVYNEYSFIEDAGCPLINSPINKSVSYNQFDGSATYSIRYSNDDVIGTGCVTEYSYSIDSSVGDSVEITESVSIQGLGGKTYPDNQKYTNAKNCFADVLLNTGTRISGIAASINTQCCSGFIPTRLSVRDSESNGTISYSRTYSCDDKYKVGAPFTERTCSTSDEGGVPLHQTFAILGQGEEIVGGCRSGNSTLANLKNTISLRTAQNLTLSDFLSGAYSCVTQPESGQCSFINNASYSYSSSRKLFRLDIDYNYVKHQPIRDITIR